MACNCRRRSANTQLPSYNCNGKLSVLLWRRSTKPSEGLRTGFRFALDPKKVADRPRQFRQGKRFEQDVADPQLPRPLTDFSGRVTRYQHKMARPVLADCVEHLKAFHIGQAVIEHQHVGGKGFGQTDSRRSVMCNRDVQPLRRQIILKVLCKQLFVFDNQYFVNQGRLLETAGPMTPP